MRQPFKWLRNQDYKFQGLPHEKSITTVTAQELNENISAFQEGRVAVVPFECERV